MYIGVKSKPEISFAGALIGPGDPPRKGPRKQCAPGEDRLEEPSSTVFLSIVGHGLLRSYSLNADINFFNFELGARQCPFSVSFVFLWPPAKASIPINIMMIRIIPHSICRSLTEVMRCSLTLLM
jgi:hypothetical protein